MTDQKSTDPEACPTGTGFVVPGTPDIACDSDEPLEHCVHCGAGLSAGTEFCQVCSTAISGGEHPHDHDTADKDA
jgi:hypothetical protein